MEKDTEQTVEQLIERIEYLEMVNEQLKESEQRYHKMIAEVQDYAIILLDINGIIQNWNKGAEKIKGYKDKEIIGQSFKIFYLQDDQKNGLPEQLILDAIKHGAALHEGWRVRKNGSTFWGSIVITALHDENGGVVGFSKVTRDLTEKRLSENRLKEYSKELEAKNKELEQFVYIASHDMKEPLRKVILYGGLIKESLPGSLGPKETVYLDKVINGANRMRALIDDLLDYSIVSMQQRPLEDVDLNVVLAETLVLYHELIAESGAAISAERLPVIKGIPFQMGQLFENVIGNAIKYRLTGLKPVITITCGLVEPPRAINLMNQNGYHKISITDNGMGFEEKYSKQIFDIFQRLVRKDEFDGTGIGLAICKRVVQNHRGDIVAHGKLGEGATFEIYLPID